MISCFKGAFRVTGTYGNRILNGVSEFHKGLDLVGVEDILVYAVSDGRVRTAFQANGAGNYVVVTMPDGRRIFYMHLRSFLVQNGAEVRTGQPIGIMGNTGNSYGAHTHLELRPEGTTSNSLDICAFTGIPNRIGLYYYNPNTEPEEGDGMTQEKFDRMMEDYLRRRAELPPEAWSEQARAYCEAHGIFVGDPNGAKRYQSFITREEAAQIVYRAENVRV